MRSGFFVLLLAGKSQNAKIFTVREKNRPFVTFLKPTIAILLLL